MLIINQEPVDPALIEDAFQRIKTSAEMLADVSCCERDEEFLAQAEEEVIDGILLAQEAEKRHAQLDETLVKEAMEKALREWRANGASWELIEKHHPQIHQETTAALRMELFTKELFADIDEPTDEEVSDYYQEHQDEFFRAPAVHAQHLLRFPDHSHPWNAYRQMLELRQQVIDGADFATLAREHTEKQNQEIDLDWITMERILHPFEAILFSLGEKEISPVISHENAFHLVYPLEIKPAVLIGLEEKSDEIRNRIVLAKKQKILRDLATSLRTQAVIERKMSDHAPSQ
jgi:parvulin-like peptidyl-prolyl isomerase